MFIRQRFRNTMRLAWQAGATMFLAAAAGLAMADIKLATNGTTTYQIVRPAKPSAVDDYAVNTLARYLKQITEADFPVVTPDKVAGDRRSIHVGLSAPVLARVGHDPLAALRDQEYVVASHGEDVFLHGKGIHGNLHAVMDFLENSLGWRWYSVFEKPVLPSTPTVTLKPFDRKRGFSFRSREVGLRQDPNFYYQRGLNMGFGRRDRNSEPAFVPYLRNDKFVHASFAYIPPSPDTVYSNTFPWIERTNYFATNPDFFSMNTSGNRVASMQLCFGNPALRKELTRNILKHIAVAPGNDIITLDAADTPGAFCYCPRCKALENRYQCSGGPIYDYLIELCGLLEKEHPKVLVKTLAYRRSQTQKPPILPTGGRLPDNLIISFAPIDDCFFADWTHLDPRIQETYRDLQAWNKITKHLWAWLYPNPWGSAEVLPVGNVRRNINNMRLMHKAGVEGVFTDHRGVPERAGLSELQCYLIHELMRDVNCDAEARIREFTDHQYGPAAALARRYLDELEQGREAMTTLPPEVTYSSRQRFDDNTFPYLTAANLFRWQGYFDQMEAQAAGHPENLPNVRLLRRELDFATLWKWFELRKAHPDYFKDPAVFSGRITAANSLKAPSGATPRPLAPSTMADFLAVIEGGGVEKPLPPEFDGIDRSRIRTFVPTNSGRQTGPRRVKDPAAAWGYATTVHQPDMPFQVGFHQWESRQPPKGKQGPRIKLDQNDITVGKYRLYKLGAVTITPDCCIWFSAKSWGTLQQLGDRLYEPGAANLWEAWVSLKFEGSPNGGAATRPQVLCDRIILVKQP